MLSVLSLGKCLTHYCLNKIRLLLGIRMDVSLTLSIPLEVARVLVNNVPDI